MNINEISKKVNDLFKKCNIDLNNFNPQSKHKCIIDLYNIASCLKIQISEHDFADNISGAFYKEDDNKILGVNINHPLTRKRFTIAHEIGHYMLHSEDELHYDDDDKLSNAPKEEKELFFRSEISDDTTETEANIFAANLLMPEELIKKCIDLGIKSIEEFADCFNVSQVAMRYRLTNLSYL